LNLCAHADATEHPLLQLQAAITWLLVDLSIDAAFCKVFITV
jgi:hypothetical protein